MTRNILILGGTGRIGRAVANDLLAHTPAHLTLTGRGQQKTLNLDPRESVLALDLADQSHVAEVLRSYDLVIHCAGPFRDRDHHVLETCIDYRVPYLDVADSPDYVKGALKLHPAAIAKNTIAVLSTGVFPGISCSMVRQAIEQLDRAEQIHISYLVAGSGGAGVTVMRTTFTELQTPFECKQQGKLQVIQPYSAREVCEFPVFGQGGVYWFNTIEALTFAESFPDVQTITTKFGSVPDFYNHLTWLVAQAPKAWIQNPQVIEFLSQVSYKMTQVSDRFSGIGLAMRASVMGEKNRQPCQHLSTFYCDDTATCAGQGAGMVAALILDQKLAKSGVWPVEQILPTSLFQAGLSKRGLTVKTQLLSR